MFLGHNESSQLTELSWGTESDNAMLFSWHNSSNPNQDEMFHADTYSFTWSRKLCVFYSGGRKK